MTRLFARVYDGLIVKAPVATLAVLAALLLFCCYHAGNFKLDASPDTLLLEDDQDLKTYREIVRRYRIKEFLFVTFTPQADLFSRPSLARLKELREELLALDRVESVISLLDIPLLKSSGAGLSGLKPENIRTLKDPNVDLQKAAQEVVQSPIYRNYVISADAKTTALQINLKSDTGYETLLARRQQLLQAKRERKLEPGELLELEKCLADYEKRYEFLKDQRHRDIQTIRSLIAPFRKYAEIHLGGVPMVADDMIEFIKSDLSVFGLGVFIFVVITLVIIFREVRWVLIPLLCCFFAVLVMVGLLGFMNWKVTVISSNFISLMLILTMSMNIHLAVRYRQLCREMASASQAELVLAMAAKMVLPCLYTALTTILAFFSLLFSCIRPVIDFGWMMTIGLTITFLTSFLLFPAVLVLMRRSVVASEAEKRTAVTSVLASVAVSHGGKVIAASILMAIFSLIGISRLKVENSFINYFRQKTEIYQGLKLIDEQLGGTTPLEIIISFGDGPQSIPEGDVPAAGADEDLFEDDGFEWEEESDPGVYWFTPYKIKKIEAIHEYLESLPEVGKVLSLSSILRVIADLNDGKKLDSIEMGILYKKIPGQLRDDTLTPYVSFERNEARISLRILDSLKNIRRGELLEKITGALENNFGLKSGSFKLAGLLVLYNNMLQSLFRSQIMTLGIVLLGIALMLLVLFRSVGLAVIGIIPNILAVAIVLGIMGLAGIALDMMTITIAAITMGIAIDNSIHYIYRFKEEYAKSGDYAATLNECHSSVGRAIVNTSVTIIFGFSILVLSNFKPTIYFGIFTGLAMLIAMLAILTLLPYLILTFKPFEKSN